MPIITPLSRRKPDVYADFHKDLSLHPVSFDLARRLDEQSIRESIRNLVLTNRGERPFQPELGCDLRSLLFENMGPEISIVAKDLIKTVIENYEPRCNLLNVEVRQLFDEGALDITIVFNVINIEEPITLNIILDRVR